MRTTWIFLESAKVVKKNPCVEKIWRRGKGKGSEIYISSMGKGASFFRGGIFRILGGREVGPVFAIKGYKRGGGCLPMTGIIGILQSLRGEIR